MSQIFTKKKSVKYTYANLKKERASTTKDNFFHQRKNVFIDGDDLEVFRQREAISLKHMFTIIEMLVKDLENLHNSGYYHTDIKPSNIIITTRFNSPEAHITDLSEAIPKTQNFNMSRTLEYDPPENSKSKASEYYSLGLVVYFMETGKHPKVLDRHHPIFKDLEFEKWSSPFMMSIVEGLTASDPRKRQWEVFRKSILGEIDIDESYAMMICDMAHCSFFVDANREKIAFDRQEKEYYGIHFAEMGIITPEFIKYQKKGIIDNYELGFIPDDNFESIGGYDYLSLFASLNLPTIPNKVALDTWNSLKLNICLRCSNAFLAIEEKLSNLGVALEHQFDIGLNLLYISNTSCYGVMEFMCAFYQYLKYTDCFFLLSSLMSGISIFDVQFIIGFSIERNIIDGGETAISEDFFHIMRDTDCGYAYPISSQFEAIDKIDECIRFLQISETFGDLQEVFSQYGDMIIPNEMEKALFDFFDINDTNYGPFDYLRNDFFINGFENIWNFFEFAPEKIVGKMYLNGFYGESDDHPILELCYFDGYKNFRFCDSYELAPEVIRSYYNGFYDPPTTVAQTLGEVFRLSTENPNWMESEYGLVI